MEWGDLFISSHKISDTTIDRLHPIGLTRMVRLITIVCVTGDVHLHQFRIDALIRFVPPPCGLVGTIQYASHRFPIGFA
jgi:hypothetical protein